MDHVCHDHVPGGQSRSYLRADALEALWHVSRSAFFLFRLYRSGRGAQQPDRHVCAVYPGLRDREAEQAVVLLRLHLVHHCADRHFRSGWRTAGPSRELCPSAHSGERCGHPSRVYHITRYHSETGH